jgi:glutaredoxin
MEMIERSLPFEYCSIDHSNQMLVYYKSIYKHETVPMIIEIDKLTGQEKFIGGFTDLIKYFRKGDIKTKVCSLDGEG